jgi:DNA replication protein DnaC
MIADLQTEKILESLQKTHERTQRERRHFMSNQPQAVRCRVHPDCERLIDEKLTAVATSNNFGQFKAGYTPCRKCLDEAQLERLQGYGVPENLLHATFENFMPDAEDDAVHVEVVQSFCETKRGFLILLGGYGTGKSHLAAAAFRVYGRGWFTGHNSLLMALRATYRDNAAFNPIEKAQSARLFVLDDVGLSAGGKDELPMLHEILNHRHGQRLPTIITSNLQYEGLTSVFGERMTDRLRESAFRVLTFTGASHRREARDRYFAGE